MSVQVEIWTDGACDKEKNAGWAYVAKMPFGQLIEMSGSMQNSTSQRAEITALYMALWQAHEAKLFNLIIHIDSAYVMNCFEDQWYVTWEKRGWISSNNKPVKNRDLWEPLIELYRTIVFTEGGSVRFIKVKGHSGEQLNERADRLAREARERLLT